MFIWHIFIIIVNRKSSKTMLYITLQSGSILAKNEGYHNIRAEVPYYNTALRQYNHRWVKKYLLDIVSNSDIILL